MSYLSGNVPGNLEEWEKHEGQYISRSLSSLPDARKLTVLLSVGVITAIEISNRLSINVLLPDMQGNVAANADEISWVVNLYSLGFLCSLALSTWMTRVVGARRHLLCCIGLYSVGAFGCFLSARSLESLLISRLIMGFGGGAFLVRTVILAGLMFPGAARIRAVTYLYSLLFIFQITYPVAMGWINDQLHWNYAFLIDFPFLTIGAFMIWKFVPAGYLFRREQEANPDITGALLLIVSLACLQLATSRGERDLWFESAWIPWTLLASLICFIIFLWRDSRPENLYPVFHLRMIWKQGALRTSFSVVLIVGAILGAGLFVVPQYLRYVQDYSAMQTGGFISMYTAGLGLGLIVSLRFLVPRLGGPRTLGLGLCLLIATCASLIYIWTPTTPTEILAPAIFLQGLALAPTVLAAANVATANTPLPDLNDISTTYFFVRQLGNTFGVTAATVLFDHRMTFHSSRMLDVANRLDPITRSTLAQYTGLVHRNGGGGSNPALGALQIFQGNVITQSRLLSYLDIYFGLAALAALGLFLLAFTRIEKKYTDRHHFHVY
ncbi:MAG: MFS transporter [Candidatus Acidiferrum sp.]|jgi:DHA2 family multidrug resistance protein